VSERGAPSQACGAFVIPSALASSPRPQADYDFRIVAPDLLTYVR